MAGLYSRQKDWNDGDILTEADLEAEFDHIYNSVVAGTTSTVGCVQLEDSVTSTSVTKAATPKSVKEAYDHAGGGGGGGLEWSLISTNTSAVAAHGYLINASAAAITLTLPISPSVGDTVGVCDAYNKATTNTITINRNAQNIEGSAENLVVDIDGAGFTLVFAGATRGWEIVTEMAGVSGGGLSNIVEDTTPQLGGNLDMNGKSIGGNTEAQIDDAVSKKHSANGDTALGTQTEALEMGGFSINDINVINIKASSCKVHNNTGATLSAGICVYPTGVVGSVVAVAKCDSTDKDKMPCLGIISADIANGAEGKAVTCGIKSMNTSGFTGAVGDRVYVQSDGTIDTVEPATGSVQRVGMLVVKDANGKIYAHSRGRKSIYAAADEHPIIRMGSTGHLKASFHKYDNTEVASIDADGNLTLNGTVDGRDVDTDGTKLDTIETSADITDAVNIASTTHGTGAKTTPVNADELGLVDSAASWVLKKFTWANLKATLKTYFDTLYNEYVHPNHSGEVTSVADGAQTITNKAVTLAKMADMATASLLGRNTAGTGVPEVLSKATTLSLLNVEDGATADNISDANVTDLTDGLDTTLHDHDGISENTGARHTQGSDTALGAQSENLDMNTHKVVGIVDPTANQDAATKKYVDDCKASKTTGAWSKSIGSGGDYATWAAMVATMPDMIAHAVTVTIKAGTTLTETCNLKNKHGLTTDAAITIQAEKSFPASGELPTADSATATTLRDAALATAALGDDYFNGCWVFIVDGTGTDNGFVAITDYIDATGDVVVASWPGTQPDNTSRYLILGALIDSNSRYYGIDTSINSVSIHFKGIGVKTSNVAGILSVSNHLIILSYCGLYGNVKEGLKSDTDLYCRFQYGGVVNNNTNNGAAHAGLVAKNGNQTNVQYCGISDNNQRGLLIRNSQFSSIGANFGDGNGVWGTYAENSGQAHVWGTECSGSSGNHSNGTGDGSLVY